MLKLGKECFRCILLFLCYLFQFPPCCNVLDKKWWNLLDLHHHVLFFLTIYMPCWVGVGERFWRWRLYSLLDPVLHQSTKSNPVLRMPLRNLNKHVFFFREKQKKTKQREYLHKAEFFRWAFRKHWHPCRISICVLQNDCELQCSLPWQWELFEVHLCRHGKKQGCNPLLYLSFCNARQVNLHLLKARQKNRFSVACQAW